MPRLRPRSRPGRPLQLLRLHSQRRELLMAAAAPLGPVLPGWCFVGVCLLHRHSGLQLAFRATYNNNSVTTTGQAVYGSLSVNTWASHDNHNNLTDQLVSVPNAAKIAYLLSNYGLSANSSAIDQDALQAAIWTEIYGSSFVITRLYRRFTPIPIRRLSCRPGGNLPDRRGRRHGQQFLVAQP